MNIYFKKIVEDAILPCKNTKDDVGYDVYAVSSVVIPAHSYSKVAIGLQVSHIDYGLWIRVESRSGLAFKNGIFAFNGIIDNGYRGEIGILLFNFSNKNYQIKKGDKIAQLVVYNYNNVNVGFSDSVSSTDRGSSGFGSSDKGN